MTSTGTFQGLNTERKSSKVLRPPGGGSSDIFGAGGEEATSPRRIKNHNQSSLGTALFGSDSSTPSTGTTSPDSPRSNKPGNDSYNRLFGPPVPTNKNAKNHMRSNIPINGDDNDTSRYNGTFNGGTKCNGNAIINGNSITNDVTAFRRIKRFRGTSCMIRNPVTGDGIDVTPVRRSARRSRDGNPVTGTGYAESTQSQNGGGSNSSASSINGDNKSTTDSSPGSVAKPRSRVPPGGYSSGLW